MPVTLNSYTYTAIDGGITINYLKTPWRTSKPRRKYPIDGNDSLWFIDEEYLVLIDYYVRPATSLRHPTESATFFIKDSDLTDVGNGVGKFNRTWALLPGAIDKGYTHTEYESFNFTVPAIDTAQQLFYQFPVASSTVSNGRHIITVSTGAPPFDALDIEVGKPATIFYTVIDPKTGQAQSRQVVKTALAVTTNTVTVEQIRDIGSIIFSAAQRADVNQPSYVKTVASKLVTSYWIVGANCTSMEDIPIINQLDIIDNSTGGRVQYLSETTTPSIDDWYEKISNKEYVCVESSVIRRWSGNVFSKTERYIRATL